MQLNKLLLLTDFSECSRQAYRAAADLARQHDAKIILTNVFQFPRSYAAMDFYASPSVFEVVRKEATGRLLQERDLSIFEGLDVTTRLLEGYAPNAIVEYVRREAVDWIVLASHGRSGFGRFLLGSFAQKVIRQAPVPVLTVREAVRPETEGPAFQPRGILLPHDFSPVTDEILNVAKELALTYDATLTLLHVWSDPLGVASAHPDAAISAIAEKLENFARKQLQGVTVQTEVMRGNPARKILACAEAADMDLICMATHGAGGLEHLVLGSVTERVLRHATCPVLTLKPSKEKIDAELALQTSEGLE